MGRIARYRKRPDRLPAGLAGSGQADEETTRRLKIKSMPQFFEKRFGGRGIKRFCVAVIFVFLLPYSASVYKGLTSVCAVLLKVDERVCMVVIALAAAAIVVLGGYAATPAGRFRAGDCHAGGGYRPDRGGDPLRPGGRAVRRAGGHHQRRPKACT